jgi:hypothetical protein
MIYQIIESIPDNLCTFVSSPHVAAGAPGVVLKSWLEGWRITCPVCRSPLSEGERPRSGNDTIRETSRFSNVWDTALQGEEIVNRHLNSAETPLPSPIAMMQLLLILSWRQAEASADSYQKSWLLNEIVPGFDGSSSLPVLLEADLDRYH